MKQIPQYIIILLLGALLLERECSGDRIAHSGDTSLFTYKSFDTNTYHINPVVKPSPVYITYNHVPAIVDTAEILKDYFATYHYNISVADSNLTGSVSGRISRNRIDTLAFKYKWLKPVTITNTVITRENKKKLFAGFHVGLSRSGITDFGPEAIFVTAKDRCYKANFDFIDKSISAGMHWKISFNKK